MLLTRDSQALFDRKANMSRASVSFELSYMEIYKDDVFDLMVSSRVSYLSRTNLPLAQRAMYIPRERNFLYGKMGVAKSSLRIYRRSQLNPQTSSTTTSCEPIIISFIGNRLLTTC